MNFAAVPALAAVAATLAALVIAPDRLPAAFTAADTALTALTVSRTAKTRFTLFINNACIFGLTVPLASNVVPRLNAALNVAMAATRMLALLLREMSAKPAVTSATASVNAGMTETATSKLFPMLVAESDIFEAPATLARRNCRICLLMSVAYVVYVLVISSPHNVFMPVVKRALVTPARIPGICDFL